jgi:hypothetical protein
MEDIRAGVCRCAAASPRFGLAVPGESLLLIRLKKVLRLSPFLSAYTAHRKLDTILADLKRSSTPEYNATIGSPLRPRNRGRLALIRVKKVLRLFPFLSAYAVHRKLDTILADLKRSSTPEYNATIGSPLRPRNRGRLALIRVKKVLRLFPFLSAYAVHRKLDIILTDLKHSNTSEYNTILSVLHELREGFSVIRQAVERTPPIRQQTAQRPDQIGASIDDLRALVQESSSSVLHELREGFSAIRQAVEQTPPIQQQTAQRLDQIGASIDGLRGIILESHLSLGRILAKADLPWDAMQCYDRVIALGWRDGRAYSYYAQSLLRVGQVSNALDMICSALGVRAAAPAGARPIPAPADSFNISLAARTYDSGAGITVATSLMPRRLPEQQAAVRSWLRLGLNVISVNSAEEIGELRPHFPGIRFFEAARTAEDLCGKPLVPISELILQLKESNTPIIGIVNSDIIFEEPNVLTDIMRSYVAEHLLFGHRIDIDRKGSRVGFPYSGGYDFFFFERSHADVFSSPDMVMGMPWWDFWMPFAANLNGLRLIKLDGARIFHNMHSIGYSNELFLEFGRRFAHSLGNMAAECTTANESQLTELTCNIFSALGGQVETTGDPLPLTTVGTLCSFANFFIDHLSTPLGMDEARQELNRVRISNVLDEGVI